MAWKMLLSLLVAALLSIQRSRAYYVTVEAHSEECFYEKLTSGTKLLLTFEVVQGGSLDIDVKVETHAWIRMVMCRAFR